MNLLHDIRGSHDINIYCGVLTILIAGLVDFDELV